MTGAKLLLITSCSREEDTPPPPLHPHRKLTKQNFQTDTLPLFWSYETKWHKSTHCIPGKMPGQGKRLLKNHKEI